MQTEKETIRQAIAGLMLSGQFDDLHKGWFIDQVLRILTGCTATTKSEQYKALVANYQDRTGEAWDTGIAP